MSRADRVRILRGPLRDHAADGFVPVPLAAVLAGRSVRTIRTWLPLLRQRKVDGQTLVFTPDVARLTAERDRRNRLRTG